MEIRFCYVPGISRENTLSFSTKEDQISYFTSLQATKVITNTFYPPYYRNNIKVDTADIDLDDNYNYVYFEYNNKYYFYFISNISYISEDVLSISITMDTIQTYFFDITLHSAVIRRKFIDRYDSYGNINRNYIRENVSLNLKEIVKRINFSDDTDIKGWYFIIQTNDKNHQDVKYIARYKNPKGVANVPYYITAIPDFNFDSYITFDCNTLTAGQKAVKVYPWLTLATEAALAVTSKVVYVPGNVLKAKITGANNVVTIKGYSEVWIDDATHRGAIVISSKVIGDQLISNIFFDNYFSINQIYLFDFVRNEGTFKLFSKWHVPALLDENYINIAFGDSRAMSTFPLHLLTKSVAVTLNYSADYLGYVYYNILSTQDADYFNDYNTLVSASSSNIDLLIDRATEYDANQKWNIAGAIASTVIGVAASVITANPLPAIGAVSSSVIGVGASITANNANYHSFAPKRPPSYSGVELGDRRLKYNYRLAPWVGLDSDSVDIGNYNNTTEGSPGINIPGSAVYSFNNLTSAITTKANAYSAPSSVKSYGSRMQDLGSGVSDIHAEISYVHDLDACAQYYHRYGYLVNEYISSTSTIFSDINTRFYYNYLELAECDVELSCLQFDSCINDISNRFKSGLRLWNPTITTNSSGTSITFDVGNYSYDNVERSALNG